MSEPRNHYLMSNPICPWCEAWYRDAWELNLGDNERADIECSKCGRPYTVTAYHEIEYSSVAKKSDEVG